MIADLFRYRNKNNTTYGPIWKLIWYLCWTFIPLYPAFSQCITFFTSSSFMMKGEFGSIPFSSILDFLKPSESEKLVFMNMSVCRLYSDDTITSEGIFLLEFPLAHSFVVQKDRFSSLAILLPPIFIVLAIRNKNGRTNHSIFPWNHGRYDK